MANTKACVDCGVQFPAFPANTKRCFVCRILKESLTGPQDWRDTPATCKACGQQFWPVRQSHEVCEDCAHPLGDPAAPPCQKCHQHNRVLPGLENTGKPVCFVCLEGSRDVRDRYLDGHLPKYRRQVAESNRRRTEIPPPPAPVQEPAAPADTREEGSLSKAIQERIT